MQGFFTKKRLTPFQTIVLGFAAVILSGALILMLPISSASGRITPFHEALFTSTSSVCVTGLVVHDTGSYWSNFGQSVILLLIQVGGLGVITVAASFAILSGRKISLLQRSTMQEAFSAPKVGGIVRLTGFILKCTFTIELIGALLMMPVFIRDNGSSGIFMAFFHSISAFCNAGFDIMGRTGASFSSLTTYRSNPLINTVIILLIIIGGLGFLTWEDIYTNRHHFKRYRMQSKVIFTMTGILVIFPALFYFFCDLTELPTGERIAASLFQSVTPRTAGFNTYDLTKLSGVGKSLMIVLMLIGGAPGSTAGGMKTTTIAVLFSNTISVFRRQEEPHLFARRIDNQVVRYASTILIIYAFLFTIGGLLISAIDDLPIGSCLFETASAVGTVGLSQGITPSLSTPSLVILMILMFLGRVGGLTLIFAAISRKNPTVSKLPQERITVG
ncbi:MAG: Trk family potassium uptake protein [Clostridiales bacterium]|nr:Trk family potassium uptake protein [Clostridiales bacterium]